jgi:hypothetical protein
LSFSDVAALPRHILHQDLRRLQWGFEGGFQHALERLAVGLSKMSLMGMRAQPALYEHQTIGIGEIFVHVELKIARGLRAMG